MNNPQYIYSQPQMPMQPPMPQGGAFVPPQISRRGRRRMAEQVIFPKWLSKNALIAYFLALAVVTFMYSTYSIPWYYMLSGVVSMMVFFLYGAKAAQDTSIEKIRKEKNYEKKIFIIAFVPRLLWMLLIYTLFMQNYGDAFGFENGDATGYDKLGFTFKEAMSNVRFFDEWKNQQSYIDVSDLGYAAYLGLVYWIVGCSGVSSYDGIGADSVGIIAVRLMKCAISAFTAILIYRLAKQNFGEQTGRVAAIFVALWPNFWYYCGTHLKETEMVFLAVLFVEQADQMLRSRQFTAWKVIPVLLIAAAIFTVRTPLGLVALLTLVFSIVMSSSKVVSWGKRIIVGFLAVALIGVVAGNQIEEKSRMLWESVESHQQEGNMEWRSERDNGNAFAKYAGAAVFAPMIFTIPFPTMVRPFEGQEVQQLLHGGNIIKNILSGFTILALVILMASGKWREHLLPLSFMLGYLVVLTVSTFAHSERFHQPVMPFEFMFAAYGLSIALEKKKYKRWFTYWCVLIFVAAIAWNWFKMAGRGLN